MARKKIVFIGAGSYNFTRNLCRDLLTFDAFRDAELALVDIDDGQLDLAYRMVSKIVKEGNYPATITCTKDRREVLSGADGILITISCAPREIINLDVDIPAKYGVSYAIGDTRGPAGYFYYLRNIPELLNICKDVEELCPEAIVLNYTNPMAMLCRTMQEVYPNLKITGLCHSVQGTAGEFAHWLNIKREDIKYTCVGINHQAFYIDLKYKGEDLYPMLRKAAEDPEIFNIQPVRFEMFKRLGYFSPEGAGHHSEYVSWFRKRPDLLDKWCMHGTGKDIGVPNTPERRAANKDTRDKTIDEWMNTPVDLKRGIEYAAYIFNAAFGDNTPFQFNGNIRNFGLVDNLPEGCCVESPVWVSEDGFQPVHVGRMPDHLAVLVNLSAQCEELVVHAFLEGDLNKLYQAAMFDPLTSAVLDMQEAQDMIDEMLAANKDYITCFNK